MTDIAARIAQQTVIASGDYHTTDPAAVTLKKDNATVITVTVSPSALSGAGCTVTCTVTDADTSAAIGSALVVTAQADASADFTIPASTHRVTITCVGSGTRTTLTYAVKALWHDITYGPNVYFDGTAYVTSGNEDH